MAGPAPTDFTLDLDLTTAGQDARELPRLYPGDKVRWRFQYRLDGVAVDLTGYTITWTARRKPTDPAYVFRRRSTDAIAGAAPATNEIVLDAGQAAEDTVNFTGKGWFEARFESLAAEETELLAAVGKSYHDMVLEAPDGTQVTYAVGVLEIPYRQTKFVDVP